MRRFTQLYEALDAATPTSAKVEAMAAYFRAAPPEDAAWAAFFLTGRRRKRLISGRVLRQWAGEAAGLPEWLLADAHAAVGDSAETVALLVDAGSAREVASPLPLHHWMEARILPLDGLPAAEQQARVRAWWTELSRSEALVLNKLLTGTLRVGVSQLLVVRALAEVASLPAAALSHRLMGRWQPSAAWFRALLAPQCAGEDRSRPYPFLLASPLEATVESLGSPEAWLAEWKWDGIRAQLIRRAGEVFLWSRGEELITARFPEIVRAAGRLPDGVALDGEVLAWGEQGVLPFAVLQQRIGRERLTPKVLEAAPACFLAYDLLEEGGIDLRQQPTSERRARLEQLLQGSEIRSSPTLEVSDWADLEALRASAREGRVEGLMLKRRDAPYGAGRRRGAWWKWKVEPLTIDAVLVYAQAGSGRRANLFTDYTFALWRDGALVPVAKACSGLSDEEILALDRWIRRHTLERFGPVRAVEPVQVFELAFEAAALSSRHKSGVALRLPRILRWRPDKPAAEADRIEHLLAMIR